MKILLLGAALLFAACGKPAGGDSVKTDSWDVLKGDRKVLWMKAEPGPITSTGMLPPGAKPATHPFLTAQAKDPGEENALHDLLEQSKDFPDFVARLEKAGYTVQPAK
jgi:hypothetical protein